MSFFLRFRAAVLAIVLCCALMVHGTASASIVPFADGGTALQGVLDDITLAPVWGSSSVSVATDGLADSVDSVWAIGGSGGSITTLVIELAGFAANNKFGIYDAKTPGSTVQVFDGAASAGSQAMISILANGSVIVNFVDTGIDFASNSFGFYLDTQVDQPGVGLWRSDTGLNSDGLDHLAAYEGLGVDTIQILPFAAGVWGTNEYILAWEDLDNSIGGADRDYTDFVVLVESVSPVTLPEPGSIMVWSLLASLGVGLMVRKRIGLS